MPVTPCTHEWQRDGIDPAARKCSLCGVLGRLKQSGARSKFVAVEALLCRVCKAPAKVRGVYAQRVVALCDFCGSVAK
jgi:hypothetical protein